jgi:competence protein ComGC
VVLGLFLSWSAGFLPPAGGHPIVGAIVRSRGRLKGTIVDTWVIVLIVVVVVVLLALLALAISKRSRVANVRKREQAREHLQEAQIRGARADKEQALAEEEAARARRELAEVQERASLAEQDARARAARADEDRTAAEELRARAERLAPDVGADGHQPTRRLDGSETTYPDQPGAGGATRR